MAANLLQGIADATQIMRYGFPKGLLHNVQAWYNKIWEWSASKTILTKNQSMQFLSYLYVQWFTSPSFIYWCRFVAPKLICLPYWSNLSYLQKHEWTINHRKNKIKEDEIGIFSTPSYTLQSLRWPLWVRTNLSRLGTIPDLQSAFLYLHE